MELKPAVAGADRLSSLPAQLQDEILVRLDLRDAVRTSALSRAWRDLWKSLSADDVKMPYTLPFTFYNLNLLRLYMDFTETRPILFMFTLLRSCHNLQNLEIESRDGDGQSFEADRRFLNALWTDGMCANLQTVEMSSIIWLPNEISFMKLVLSKARRLRTLSVDSHPDDFDDPIIDLLNYKRASPQTRVLFEGSVRQY